MNGETSHIAVYREPSYSNIKTRTAQLYSNEAETRTWAMNWSYPQILCKWREAPWEHRERFSCAQIPQSQDERRAAPFPSTLDCCKMVKYILHKKCIRSERSSQTWDRNWRITKRTQSSTHCLLMHEINCTMSITNLLKDTLRKTPLRGGLQLSKQYLVYRAFPRASAPQTPSVLQPQSLLTSSMMMMRAETTQPVKLQQPGLQYCRPPLAAGEDSHKLYQEPGSCDRIGNFLPISVMFSFFFLSSPFCLLLFSQSFLYWAIQNAPGGVMYLVKQSFQQLWPQILECRVQAPRIHPA